MPKRQLPNSNPSRYRALKAVKDRKDVTPPADVPLTAGTVSRFDLFFPQYKTKYLAVSSGLSAQTGITSQIKKAKVTAGYFVADFIDALQNAIRRETFAESVRALYGLPVNKPLRPEILTEQDVLDWGERVHDGETARIAAGGAPISFPSLAEVDGAVNNFKTLNLNQAAAKGVYDAAQEAIEADNVEADKLILKLWNEFETAFDEGNKPSMRRKAREWGVVYVPTAGEAPSPDDFSVMGKVIDTATGTALTDAAILVSGTDIIVLTDEQGKYLIPVLPTGTYFITAYKPGYQVKEMPDVTVTTGAITTLDMAMVAEPATGTVKGIVKQTGMGVAAKVGVDGTTLSVDTDAAGNYTLSGVPIGSQTIRATLTGGTDLFQTQIVNIDAGMEVTADFNF